ncbi:polyprenyl glycosylphosphotransferase [Nibricoccus aquaticus]|uniref:Polyprenyl glycosylphosphotransferase n=1 Tax=Nibricoccus aquaticus TaxID=2576891 RepID=A0A290QB71_9BACT|nr:exopolysaccharide biosynthesis polyprenyl glycosylphosphotransferase [Nibricoccus aquaticus]ATC65693.1 polyprenyl glycosylphosphotransferase [Nibricoccus aquaticus]
MTIGRKMAIGLLLLDTYALAFVFNVVGWLRGVADLRSPVFDPLVVPLVLLVVAVFLIDGYRQRTDMAGLDYTSMHAIALLAAMAATLLITFTVLPPGYTLQQSRAVVAISFVALIPITLSYRRWIHLRYIRERRDRQIVFIGDATSRDAFRDECVRSGMKQKVIYVSSRAEDPLLPLSAGTNAPSTALNALLRDIQRGEIAIEAVVLRESSRELNSEASQQLVDLYFDGVPTYTLELFHQIYWRKIPLYRLNQTWLFQEGFRVAREPVFERIKRLSDIAFSLIGLTLAAPFLAVAAILIRLEDKGPVFFRQNRIGRHRAPFSLLKLRSMKVDNNGALYTAQGDARITRIGRFLRATRIDEFPQLINVLRGEMSLIGPRAEWDRLVADYEKQIPCYHFRHLVRPGITGWAQVNYPYGANLEDTLRKLEYDLYYIRHFSFTLDASIILKTIHVMLFGRGR